MPIFVNMEALSISRKQQILVFALKAALMQLFLLYRSQLARSVMSLWLTTCCGSSTWKGSPSTAWTISLWRTLSGCSHAITLSVLGPASSSIPLSSSQDAGLLYAHGRSAFTPVPAVVIIFTENSICMLVRRKTDVKMSWSVLGHPSGWLALA